MHSESDSCEERGAGSMLREFVAQVNSPEVRSVAPFIPFLQLLALNVFTLIGLPGIVGCESGSFAEVKDGEEIWGLRKEDESGCYNYREKAFFLYRPRCSVRKRGVHAAPSAYWIDH